MDKMQIVNTFVSINLPKEIVTLIISMLPIIELRGALPIAIKIFEFSVMKAYFLSVLGNILPVLPFIWFLERFSGWLMQKSELFNRALNWWFNRARKNEDLIQKYEALGLAIFVAVPLPVTGAWTASVIAYVFGIKKRYAFPAILLGVLLAGVIVLLITQSF